MRLIAAIAVSMTAWTATAAPYEAVRVGDGELSCEALTKDINGLTSEVAVQGRRAQRRRSSSGLGSAMGRGLLSGLAQGAVSMSYGASSQEALVGSLASGAADGLTSAASGATPAAGPSSRPEPPAPAPASPQQQRLDHLMAIHRQKAC